MRRVRVPDWLAGVSGAVLLASLFGAGLHVWLALTGALAVGLLIATAVRDTPAIPLAFDVLTAWAALVAIPIAIVRLIGEAEWGTVVGAVSVAGVFGGAWWAMRKQDQPGLRPPPEPRAMPVPRP